MKLRDTRPQRAFPVVPIPDLAKSRDLHYALAHRLLPDVAFEKPQGFVGILASPDAREFLSKIIAALRVECGVPESGPEPEADFDIDDFAVYSGPVAGNPAAIIEMPRPRAMTEAYFVAAVLFSWPGGPALIKGCPELRYFTLELGIEPASPPRGRTVFCERDRMGAHINYGDGPAPTVEEFVLAIERRLQGN